MYGAMAVETLDILGSWENMLHALELVVQMDE